jgi:transposase
MAGVLLFTPLGRNPRILFRLQPGSMGADDFISLLRDLKRELRGKKLLLIWDGLPAHRAKKVTDYIAREKRWLRVERYPAYAPELSPVEFIWSPMKTRDLAHTPPKGPAHLAHIVRAAFRRIRRDKTLLKSCLRKAGVLS